MPRLLDAAPIDIVCLGIGVNGHIAFNDPPVADFADPQDVKIVELDDVCRQQQVDDDCFPNLAAVPEQAVTLTIPRLLRAERSVLRRAGSAQARCRCQRAARTDHHRLPGQRPAPASRLHALSRCGVRSRCLKSTRRTIARVTGRDVGSGQGISVTVADGRIAAIEPTDLE